MVKTASSLQPSSNQFTSLIDSGQGVAMPSGVDYKSVLADLRAKLKLAQRYEEQYAREVTRLTAAVAAIIPLAGSDIADDLSAKLENARLEDIAGIGPYAGMGAVEAIGKYLNQEGPKPVKAICSALKQGGYASDAKNFYSAIYTTMFRRKDLFTNSSAGWALVAWD